MAKSFGGLRVLDGLDLRVEEGGIRCLIGPNGSGKSTLLKAIAGLHRPDSGEIRFAGSGSIGCGRSRSSGAASA